MKRHWIAGHVLQGPHKDIVRRHRRPLGPPASLARADERDLGSEWEAVPIHGYGSTDTRLCRNGQQPSDAIIALAAANAGLAGILG
jgi:hypothetical protein